MSNSVKRVEARFSLEPGSQDVNSRGSGTQAILPPRAPTDRYPSQPGHISRTLERRLSSSSSSRHRSSTSRHAPSSQGSMSLSRFSSRLGRQSSPPGARDTWGSWPGSTSILSDQPSIIPMRNHSVWQDSHSRDRPSQPISPWDSGSNYDIAWGRSPGNNIWQDNLRNREPLTPPSSQPISCWDTGKHGFSARELPRLNHPSSSSHLLLSTRFLAGTETTSSQPQQDMYPETASSQTNKNPPKAKLTLAQYAARKRVRVYDFLCMQPPDVKII